MSIKIKIPEYSSTREQTIEDFRNQVRLLYELEKTKALEFESLYRSNGFDVGCIAAEEELKKFITQDPDMLEVKHRTVKLSMSSYPVLIMGESGTGKSIIAKALHGSRSGNFVAVNCTSLPDELIESELFGHVKGSFTGAFTDKVGKMQHAAGGTLFLDEIGDMPLNMQTKLLKAVEEQVICRVGACEEIKTSCRIVCATNQPTSKIRDDLYWRISTFILVLTQLAARREDISLIAAHFNARFPVEMLKDKPLLGNVRELLQYIYRWEMFGTID